MPALPNATIIANAFQWSYDATGYLDHVNAAVTRFFGRNLEELKGRGFLDFIHPADVETCEKAISQCIETGRPVSGYNRQLAADGHYYALAWNIRPIWNDGKICCIIGAGVIYALCS